MQVCHAPRPAAMLSAHLNAFIEKQRLIFTCLDEKRSLANAKCRFDAYAEDVRLFLQQHILVSLMQLLDREPPLTIPPERSSFVTAQDADTRSSHVLRTAPLADQRHASVLSTCLASWLALRHSRGPYLRHSRASGRVQAWKALLSHTRTDDVMT